MRSLNGLQNDGLYELENADHMMHCRLPMRTVHAIFFSMDPSQSPAAASAAATWCELLKGRVALDGGKGAGNSDGDFY